MTGASGRLKVQFGKRWVDCDFGVIGLGPIHYLKVFTREGQFLIGGHQKDLAYALRAAADLIDGKQPEPLVTPGAAGFDSSVTNMTRSEVSEYFRSSPQLHTMADDVDAALKADMSEADILMSDLRKVLQSVDVSDLIDGDGNSVYGAQSRIATALAIPNAGSYRPRILAVLQELSRRTSTTTVENPRNHQKSA